MKIKENLKTAAFRILAMNRFNPENALIITSTPRSGSTWLGSLLENGLPETLPLFEPLQLRQVPEAKAAGFDWHTYRDPNEAWPEGSQFLQTVFEGRVINQWTGRDIHFAHLLSAKQVLVKFVRMNRLLPWLTHNFELLPPVLLVRHPCAVVASMLKTDWGVYHKPQTPPFLDTMPALRKLMANLSTKEEFIATHWALDLMPAMMQPKPWPWIVITYEELAEDPWQTLHKISSAWNKPFHKNKVKKMLHRPSSVVSKSGIQGTEGWKQQLTNEQISGILNITHRFGFDFYSIETQPVYHPEDFDYKVNH